MPTTSGSAWLRRTAFHAAVLVGLVFCGYLLLVAAPNKGTLASDVIAYWRVDLAQPYAGTYGEVGFFPYSPPAALLLAPLGALPWPAFVAAWYAALVGAVAWLGGRSFLVLLAFPPVAINLSDGNIHLLLAVAIVLGFRYPAAWAFVLLTKITPGVGLLWFAARGEWRSLGIAIGATAAIVVATVLVLPGQWAEWLRMLAATAGTQPPWPALPIPLVLRLPIAAAIVVWGARRDARWAVPLAAAISVPALWPGAFAILAACWALRTGGRVPAAPAGATGPDYHAPDGGQRGREPQPATA